MIRLRKLHLLLGIILALPLLVQAVTGFLLRARLVTPSAYLVHTWAFIWKHTVLILAPGLAFLAVSGGVLYISQRIQQRKRRAAQKKQAAKAP